MYEKHVDMRISVTCWTAPSHPAAAPNGRVKEHTEGPLWYASTNPREVAQALLRLTDETHGRQGLDLVVPGGGNPARATSFSVKYDRRYWTAVSASATVAQAIEEVNVPPQEVQQTLPLTRFPAGYSRL